MDEMLFHTTFRNAGLFLTLSFTSMIYYHKEYVKNMNYIILTISFIFNIISSIFTIDLLKRSTQKQPKYLIICNIVLMIHICELLLFKK